MTLAVTITFRSSSAPTYHEAVRLARQAAVYKEAPAGDASLIHTASFFDTKPETLATLSALWALVGSWKVTRLSIDSLDLRPHELDPHELDPAGPGDRVIARKLAASAACSRRFRFSSLRRCRWA
jgi:hypothetical protein